ncbi:MAG TPA: 3'-5' exonuclease, partial [Methylomirabilota bacterium]|nr:3'-5' exonuclease [Methylomirabilota bacterium]
GLQRGFRIADDDERAAMLAAALQVPDRKARSLLAAISRTKRTQCPDDADPTVATYRQALAMRNWIDFDDLVGLPVQMLGSDAGLAVLYRDRYRWISVDEFQDVDEQQYRLLRLLAPADGNLCVIGDPDQAIYGFRGADAACFERFLADYPRATTVRLARNYRSTGTIVSAASQVIATAAGKRQAADFVRDMQERITIHVAPTEAAEAEHVVHTIEQLIGGHSFFSIDSGRTEGGAAADLSFADIAVLYRTDAQSAALREAFARSGLPFRKHAHGRLGEQPAVRALLAAMDDLATDGRDRPLRTLLAAAAEQAASAADSPALHAALQQLTTLATDQDDARAFAESVALASEADCWDPRADRVSLLTIHAAKGLEFPVVFIVGIEDGLLPLRWNDGAEEAELAEERRLFYVGMTRAKDRLFLSRALKRVWRGSLRALPPSPYLADIEEELLRHSQRADTPRKPADAQFSLL